MKKIYFYLQSVCLIVLLLFSFQSTSQVEQCGSAAIHKNMMLTDAAYAQKMTAYETYVKNINTSTHRVAATVYQVPVVVHVMHKGEAVGVGTNVSDGDIQNAIKALNQRYRKVAGTLWDGNGVDVEIEYALAVRDPSGNCTNGINRVSMTGDATYMNYGVQYQTSNGITDAALKAIISWNRTQYYNIWIISEIDDNNGGNGIQGYAYFAAAHGTASDGAVMIPSSITNVNSKTLAHEIGHSLNLYHTFEGDGTGSSCPAAANGCGSGVGDCCTDIPAHQRSASTCSVGTNACDGVTARDLFIHNYMDYSSDACSNMLTADQKTRMVASLTGTRASFLGSNGNMSLVPPATAGVDFDYSAAVLCGTGQTVSFIDKSSCTPNTYVQTSAFSGVTHLWTITNGTNTYTSSVQNPTITFANSGTFNVTLAVTNSFGTTSITKSGAVVVSSAPSIPCTPTTPNAGNFNQTVNNVKFNTINSSSSTLINVAYTDLACSYNTIVDAGSSYNMTIGLKAGGSGAEVFEVYIDYNNDNAFANPSEMVFSGTTPSNSSATFTSNILIPLTAVTNTLLRMRVIGEAGSLNSAKRTCSSSLFIGDVEDYGVYIKSACVQPTISVTPTATTICSGQTVSLTASGATTYTWLPTGSGTLSAVSPTSTTIYTVTGETGGCVSTPVTVTVTVNGASSLSVSPNSPTICAGNSTTLTASGATSYTWLPGGSTSATLAITPASTTVYTLTGATGGCSSIKMTTVTVVTTPTITVTPTSTNICSGVSVVLTASGATSYTWLPSGSGASNTVTPSSTTVYTITGSNGGCFSSAITSTINVTTSPTVAVSPISPTICAGNSTTLTASGAISYTWLPGGATSTTLAITPGTTTVYTLTGANGICSSIKMTTVTVVTTPTITVTPTSTNICSGISVVLTASGATSYTWLPSGSGASNTVTPSGTTVYTITGSNGGGCFSSAITSTVNVTVSPTVAISLASTTICSGSSLTLTASGATSYTWLPGGATSTTLAITPGATTVYTLTGTTGACSSTKTTTVTVFSTPILTITPASTTICSGSSVVLTASGAVSYTWLPSGSGASNTVTPSSTTIYTITGSNGSCGSSSMTSTINVTSSLTVAVSPISPTICSGSSIVLTASGATSYTWSPGGVVTSNTVSPTSTTVYTVIGTSGSCNSLPLTTTVIVTASPTVVLTPLNTTICVGGSATLTASGATSYTWMPGGATGTSNTYSPSATTIYTIIGSASGCNSIKMATITVIGIPTITVTPNNTTICDGSSSVLNASGATSYTWLPSGSGASNTVTLSATTIYTITGSTSGDGCVSLPITSTVNVTPNPTITVAPTSPTICSGASTTLTASGATSYTWFPGGSVTANVVSPNSTTVYTVIGRALGCNSLPLTATVNVITTPTITITPSNTTVCLGSEAVLIASGAMSYTWLPGGETGASNTYTPSAATVYTVIGDNSGCLSSPRTATVNITSLPTISVTPDSPSICSGESTTLTASGAASYTWSPGGSVTSLTVSPTSTVIYTVIGTASGCDASPLTVTVTVVVTPTVIITPGSSSLCAGGTATLTAGGASTYTWLPTGSGNINVINPSATTIYTIIGTDIDNFCTSAAVTATVTVVNLVNITISNTSTTVCEGVPVVLDVLGATSYTWFPSGSGASSTLTPSSTTIYTVIGGNGSCTSPPVTSTVTIIPLPTLTITPMDPTICSGKSTVLTASGALSYTWSTGNTTASNTVTPAGVTVYTVIGSSSTCVGLPFTTTVSIITTPTVNISPATSTICTGSSNTLTAGGASTYTWLPTGSGSGSSITVSPTSTTNYTLVGSSLGCDSDPVSATINVSPFLTINVTPTSTVLCNGGSGVLTASGATSYTWLPSGSGSTSTVTPITTTIYTITGSTGACTSPPKTVTVSVATTPTINVSPTTTNLCGGQTTTLSVSGATTYTWLPSGSGSTNIVTPSATTIYTVTGNSSGCISAPSTVTVTVITSPTISLSVSSTSICSGNSSTLTASGASSYSWSPSASGPSNVVSPAATTIYSVVGTTNGCRSTALTTTIAVSTIPSITLTPSAAAICNGSSTTLTVSGAPTYIWLPSGAGTSNTVTPSSTTVYSVVGVNGACVSAVRVSTVTVIPIPTVAVTAASPTICNGSTTTLNASGALSYTWFPSGAGAVNIVSPTTTSTYTVIGNVSGCRSLPQTVTVTVGSIPTVSITPSSTTICSGQSATLTASGASSYIWAPSGSGNSVVVTPITSTTIYTLTGSNNGCNSSPRTATIYMLTTPSIIASASPAIICLGSKSTLTASGASVYTWTPGGATGASAQVTPTVTTAYSVVGSFGGSCTNSYTVLVTVNPCTGIEETLASSNEMIVFPNPSNGVFTIASGAILDKFEVIVLNTIGQVVKVETARQVDQLKVDLTYMSSGIYYLRVNTELGNKLFKVILE